MTEKEFQYFQERALRFIIQAVVNLTNKLPDFTEAQKEETINIVFNIMLNSLKPDAAITWNEEILKFSKTVETKQHIDEIMQQIQDLKDFDSGE